MIKVFCRRCGAQIFVSEKPKPIKDILEELNYRCPSCGATLDLYSMRIKVKASS